MVRKLIFSLLLPLALMAQQSQPPAASATQAMYNAQVQSTQQKFDYIRANGAKASPVQTPTVIHERELNAWLTSGDVQFPEGVKRLQLQGQPGIIYATATVDFDQVTGGRY